MKYIEIKSIKNVEEIKEELDKVTTVSPKLYLNKKTLSFILEVNEKLISWDTTMQIINSVTNSVSIKSDLSLDELRDLIPLNKTLEVISHKDINPWRPQDLLKNI